jgi:hypothetical protein
MGKGLSVKEREKLIHGHCQERNGRVRHCIKAVLAYDSGYNYSEMARILLLDDETIRCHMNDDRREEKLKVVSGGSDSKLSKQETRELIEPIREVTYLYVKDICRYVWRVYTKKYSVSGMTMNKVHAFAKELGMRLHYLPPYSPNLNPVERMWKLMHENIRYN